jgi:hypothetical protein
MNLVQAPNKLMNTSKRLELPSSLAEVVDSREDLSLRLIHWMDIMFGIPDTVDGLKHITNIGTQKGS